MEKQSAVERSRKWMGAWIVILLLLGQMGTLTLAAEPTIAERSPLSQGAWWYPARTGSGFEIFTHGSQVAVLWYTYSTDGSPIWYLAQGNLADAGSTAWPLRQHSWANGTAGPSTDVGSLRLNILHPEAAEVIWRIGGETGIWPIQPLILSGVINEIDRSGAWYSPTGPGWGISLIEQGSMMAGALYTYDAQGRPTWFSGSDAGRSGLSLLRYSGACPSCAQRPPGQSPAGRLNFNFSSETRMSMEVQLTASTAPGTHPTDTTLEQLSRPASTRAADRQLAHFTSDGEFRSHMEAGMLRLFPPVQNPQYLGVNFSPAPAASAVAVTASGTNLQEAGVDEADLVKLSGNDVWTFAHNNQSGARLPQLRRARLTPADGDINLLPAWNLLAPSNRVEQAGLYAGRDRLVSVTGNYAYVPFGVFLPFCTPTLWRNGSTDVEILDTRKADAPVRLWHARVDGFLIASRRIGDDLYLVTRHVPEVSGFDYSNASDAVRAANRSRLSNTSLSTLLPGIRINGGVSQPLVSPTRIFAPPQGARGLLADVFAVTVISLAQPGIRDSLGVMGTLDTIYMSPTALYLASARNAPVALKLQFGLPEPPNYFTDVHKVQFDNGRLTLAGSGSVEGYLDARGENAPFRMSEQDGRLRIVTSSHSQWSLGQNRLTVLEPSTSSPGLLRTASFLPNAQRPATLGKPGELLYATRFDGNRLYAVTFKKTDPLYVVDLSRPADPEITGELEVTGYSDYLHPLGNGLLLGVGLDARPAQTTGDAQFAWFQGLQLTLFDVSNDQKPRELQKILIGKRGSNSPLLTNHHAFSELRLADGTLSFAFPAALHDSLPGRPQTSDSETLPWAQTGLLRFSLKGSSPADARIEQHATLVSHAPPVLAYAPGTRAYNGRSILMPEATLFINDGQFWVMRKDGTVLPTR